VAILTSLRFIDIFDLPNKSERFLCTQSALKKCLRLLVRRKGKIVVAAFFFIRCATLRMAPDPILQNVVPDKSSPALASGEYEPTRLGSTASVTGPA
jgi:hypothetical protein